jgi:hypothetical protein
MQQWFYAKANERRGPFNVDEMKALAKRGELLSTDLVWREGMPEWVVTLPPETSPAAAREYGRMDAFRKGLGHEQEAALDGADHLEAA